ncbi:MAG TPA: TonB-dependent siderophore receptor [Frateuria sp.]|uniref:TonB-dependent siderophore receptor n=1 Tax=Frateuria sp. TaxID=2211372 RepID=UPI002D7F78CA|nr:TonB-dependent siderophore receptor [Frateuria sp.]HET6804501.1 TonB-dependent siderophore receptor [Frateuria sp.]
MTLPRTPLLLALFAALAPAAYAADAPDTTQAKELAPVRVEGRTHDDRHGTAINAYGNASLHDTPAAVTVITRQQIDDRHIRSLSELAREDASLGDNYAPVGYYQDIAIRGYPLDLATGVRFNGLTVAGEQPLALEDKQRVEVLKGLAGLQAGVMEPGGVVNFVSKRPAEVREATLGTDTHGSRYGALDLGGWLTPTFGLRANLAWEDTHAYVRHADGRRNFYALAADWHLSPDATLELDSDYQASAQRSVSGYQLLGGDTLPAHADATRMLGFEPWQQPVSIHAANTSARLNYAFDDDWRLRLAAGHSRSVIDDNVAFAYGCFYSPACASGAPGNFFAPNGDYDVYDYRSPDDTRIDDEARVALEGQVDTGAVSQQLTLGAGAFRRLNDQRADVYDYVGTANIADLDPPYFAPSPNQPGPSVRRLTSWQHSLFALDRLHLGEAWQLLAGGRFVRLHERAYDGDGVPERDTRLSKMLPQAALLWQPGEALTTYLSYSEGLSLGKEAPYWTSNDGQMLAPRLSHQLEAGMKYDLADALDLSAAVFRIHQPYQFARPDDSAYGFTFVQQGEEVHTGLELGAQGRVTANLGLTASASFIRARAQGTGTSAYEGHQVANVPRLRAAVYADYRLPFAPQLSLLGGWRYASPNVATPDGRVRVAAYNVFDAGVRYATTLNGHAFTVRLSIDNLFDRFYWRDTGSAYGDSYLFAGAPRLARLSMSYAF